MTRSTTSHIPQRVCPCIIDADLAKFMETEEVGEPEYRSCLGTPSLIPIISVRDREGFWKDFPLTKAYCQACAKVANIDDIVSPGLWRVVELYFENKGIGRADRKATTMRWITSVKFVESMKNQTKPVVVVEEVETGHGHVRPRKDGERARCGGPAICAECAVEANEKRQRDLAENKAFEINQRIELEHVHKKATEAAGLCASCGQPGGTKYALSNWFHEACLAKLEGGKEPIAIINDAVKDGLITQERAKEILENPHQQAVIFGSAAMRLEHDDENGVKSTLVHIAETLKEGEGEAPSLQPKEASDGKEKEGMEQ